MEIKNPYQESIDFFNEARENLDFEISDATELFYIRSENIRLIYGYFSLYLFFSESGDVAHDKIIEKINALDAYDYEELVYKVGLADCEQGLEHKYLFKYFQKFLHPDFDPPLEPREIAKMLFAFFIFYRDIPEKLSGDLTKLLLVVEIALDRTVARAFSIIAKVRWSDLRENYRQKRAKEGQKHATKERETRMKKIWGKIPEREKKRDYTIAREMSQFWEWNPTPTARNFVKYIRQFRKK